VGAPPDTPYFTETSIPKPVLEFLVLKLVSPPILTFCRLQSEQKLLEEVPEDESALKDQVNGHAKSSGSRKVLADGTYATESALTSEAAVKAKLEAVKAAQKPPLRQLILDGSFTRTIN
jgi:hypothetical protein